MSEWINSLTTWLSANPEWLGITLFLVAALECLAVAGILIPGTVLLFAIGMLAGNGSLSLLSTLLLAYSGGLLGDLISYGLGRRFHQNIRRLPVLRHHPEWIGQAELYFLRYGAVSLLVGRFIGPLRPMLPMVAGMLDMPFMRFLLISLLSGAGWAIAYLLPGWVAGAAIRMPLPDGFWPEAAAVVIALCVLVGLSSHASLSSKRSTTPITSALSLALLIVLFCGWPYLEHLDQGLMTLVQSIRTPATDTFLGSLTQLGDFNTQLAAGILLVFILALYRQWHAALFSAGVLLSTALANTALKHLFTRTRPDVLLEPLSSYSFPSAHSSAAFAFCLVLGVLAGRGQPPRWRLTWLLLASLPASAIAYSRIYLGVHWPSDIIGGALLAATCCTLGLLITQWRDPMRPVPGKVWWLFLPACALLFASFISSDLATNLMQYRYQ